MLSYPLADLTSLDQALSLSVEFGCGTATSSTPGFEQAASRMSKLEAKPSATSKQATLRPTSKLSCEAVSSIFLMVAGSIAEL